MTEGANLLDIKKYLVVQSLLPKDIKRIFDKISVDTPSGCWNWLGEKNAGGYGRVRYKGHKESIHRLMYAWWVAPLKRGRDKDTLVLDHLCNNKKCCNPKHLKLVTHKDNVFRCETSPTTINHNKKYCINGHLLPKEPNDKHKTKRYCKICASRKVIK